MLILFENYFHRGAVRYDVDFLRSIQYFSNPSPQEILRFRQLPSAPDTGGL